MYKKQFICAFSSDFRPLYKADVYKVCSMPNGSVIHFRYKLKYVDEELRKNRESYINEQVVIFYSPGNSLDNRPNNFSVRKAVLLRAEINRETDLFHIFMKLGDFCDIAVGSDVSSFLIPSKKFLSIVQCDIYEDNQKWYEKIETLKQFFPDISFYNIKSVKKKSGGIKRPQISKDKKGSFYKLNHGSEYFIELSLGNPNNSDCKIKFEASSEDISANIPNPIEVTAQYDDIIIPIYLKSLNVSAESSFISFIPQNGKSITSEYNLNIEVKKGIGMIRPIFFGLLTVFTVFAVFVITNNIASLSNIGNFDWKLNWWLVSGFIVLFFSSALLFREFNKK